MASQSKTERKVYTAESSAALVRLLGPDARTVDPHKINVVILEALGRMDRMLRKDGVTAEPRDLYLTVRIETEQSV